MTATRGAMPPRWYFDVISPFAYLQWPKVQALAAQREVVLVPVLLAALLAARGQKGPAEISGKREFTYRHVLWQARTAGMALRFPPAHPFNPIVALPDTSGPRLVVGVDRRWEQKRDRKGRRSHAHGEPDTGRNCAGIRSIHYWAN